MEQKQTLQSFTVHLCKELELVQLPVLQDNYIYLLHDRIAQLTAVIDPAEADPVLQYLTERNWSLDYIYNTHHHGDHVGGNRQLKERFSCRILASAYDVEHDRIPFADEALDESKTVLFGQHRFQILEFPGHTLGHIGFYLADKDLLFCGDTLFALGCGRLFEGSAAMMWNSLQKILQLPGQTRILSTHEYTLSNAKFALSLGAASEEFGNYLSGLQSLRTQGKPTVPSKLSDEKAWNPFLRVLDPSWCRSVRGLSSNPAEAFAELRRRKDQF